MDHSMTVEANGGPVHLRLTAHDSAHAMMAAEIRRLVRPDVADAAALTANGSRVLIRER